MTDKGAVKDMRVPEQRWSHTMKAYKGFLPKFYIDEEQGIIRGKTLNTRDTITFYGKTVDEALQAFRDSVDDYLEFCKEIGVDPEKPYSGVSSSV